MKIETQELEAHYNDKSTRSRVFQDYIKNEAGKLMPFILPIPPATVTTFALREQFQTIFSMNPITAIVLAGIVGFALEVFGFVVIGLFNDIRRYNRTKNKSDEVVPENIVKYLAIGYVLITAIILITTEYAKSISEYSLIVLVVFGGMGFLLHSQMSQFEQVVEHKKAAKAERSLLTQYRHEIKELNILIEKMSDDSDKRTEQYETMLDKLEQKLQKISDKETKNLTNVADISPNVDASNKNVGLNDANSVRKSKKQIRQFELAEHLLQHFEGTNVSELNKTELSKMFGCNAVTIGRDFVDIENATDVISNGVVVNPNKAMYTFN